MQSSSFSTSRTTRHAVAPSTTTNYEVDLQEIPVNPSPDNHSSAGSSEDYSGWQDAATAVSVLHGKDFTSPPTKLTSTPITTTTTRAAHHRCVRYTWCCCSRRFWLYGSLLAFVLWVWILAFIVTSVVRSRSNNRLHYGLPAVYTINVSDTVFGSEATIPSLIRAVFLEHDQKEIVVKVVVNNNSTTSSKSSSSSSSPFAQALEWIQSEDPMKLTVNDPNLVQRFIAAYFYFATSSSSSSQSSSSRNSTTWKSCQPSFTTSVETENGTIPNVIEDDVHCSWAWGMIWNGRITYETKQSIRWLSNVSECQWAGLYCDNSGQIRKLELPGHNLSAIQFPDPVVSYFPFLTSLDVRASSLQGPLPGSIFPATASSSSLSSQQSNYLNLHLSDIDLQFNQFTGSIPASFWTSNRKFQSVSVGHNALIGLGLPASQVGQLVDLKELMLYENQLTGTLPSELGLLDSLCNLDVSSNVLKGSIPNTLFEKRWNSLQSLVLSHNQFTGQLPSSINSLNATLSDLELSKNHLTGTIPNAIYQLRALQFLYLDENQLTGPLTQNATIMAENFGNRLVYFNVSSNALTASLPSELGKLRNIYLLSLQNNSFLGPMPTEVCSMVPGTNNNNQTTTTTNDEDDKRAAIPDAWSYLEADCAAFDEFTGTAAAQVTCADDCCTLCCQPGGTNCALTTRGIAEKKANGGLYHFRRLRRQNRQLIQQQQ